MQHALRLSPSLGSFLRFPLLSRPAVRKTTVATEPPHEEERSRRDFVRDMILRSPEAFSSDLDVQGMMYMYPGRF